MHGGIFGGRNYQPIVRVVCQTITCSDIAVPGAAIGQFQAVPGRPETRTNSDPNRLFAYSAAFLRMEGGRVESLVAIGPTSADPDA